MARHPDYKAGMFGLTAICGLLDATCFLALGGVFAELMTGNLQLFAFALARGELFGTHVVAGLFAIVPFTIGALLAGLWSNGRHPLAGRIVGYPAEYASVLLATPVALATDPRRVGPLEHDLAGGGPGQWARPVIVGLLAFGMGIHNALMRRHGVTDVATNVLTLTLTGLLSESRWARGTSPHWLRRALSIVIFVASAALGAWLLRYGAAAPLLLASLIFTLALWPLMRGRTEWRQPSRDWRRSTSASRPPSSSAASTSPAVEAVQKPRAPSSAGGVSPVRSKAST
jgi:uncharacterized membrane protein YoaK (UPF0700 family)